MLPAGLLSIGAIYICTIGFKETHQFSIPCDESLATVRSVSSCPMDEISFEKAAQNMSCATINNNCVRFEYHCVLNDYLNGTVEVCAPSLWVAGHVCTKFDTQQKSVLRTEDISCKNSTPPCIYKYNSTTLYNYRSCYNLSKIAQIIDKLTNPKTTAVPTSTQEDEEETDSNVLGPVLGAVGGVVVIVVAIVVGILVHKRRVRKRKRYTRKDGGAKAPESEKLPTNISDITPLPYQLMSQEQGIKEEQVSASKTDNGASSMLAKQKVRRVLEPRNKKDYAESKPNYQEYQHEDKRARKSPMSDHERIGQLEQNFLYVDTKLAEGSREREELKKRITTLEENIKREKSEKEGLQEKINELQIENTDQKKEIKELQKKLKEKDKNIDSLQKTVDYLKKELHNYKRRLNRNVINHAEQGIELVNYNYLGLKGHQVID